MTRSKAYEVLGIEFNASIEEIKTAYAELSKKYHPEENPKEFQEIHEAYITLAHAKKNHRQLAKVIAFEAQLQAENAMPEQVEDSDSFDFTDVDKAKEEDFERRVQEMINQLNGSMYSDKKLDNILLKKILSSNEREIIYSHEFIEFFIGFLNEAFVERETIKIVKKYIRPWDRTLDEQRELLDKLKVILEERKDFYYKHTTEIANTMYTYILFGIVGFMLLFCLVTNFIAVIKTVFVLLSLGGLMYLVYKFCRKNGTEWYAYMMSIFSGFAIVLIVYMFEVWKWIVNVEFAKLLNEMVLLLLGILTALAFVEWKNGK